MHSAAESALDGAGISPIKHLSSWQQLSQQVGQRMGLPGGVFELALQQVCKFRFPEMVLAGLCDDWVCPDQIQEMFIVKAVSHQLSRSANLFTGISPQERGQSNEAPLFKSGQGAQASILVSDQTGTATVDQQNLAGYEASFTKGLPKRVTLDLSLRQKSGAQSIKPIRRFVVQSPQGIEMPSSAERRDLTTALVSLVNQSWRSSLAIR